MSDTAAAHLGRIVQLVAELSRDALASEVGIPLAALAARLGVSPETVQQDLRTLTAISDDAEVEWLQSLAVWQEGDRVAAVSQGPFRRPMRFTREELLAIRVGLALEGEAGVALAARLARELAGPPHPPLPPSPAVGDTPVHVAGLPGEGELRVVALANLAIENGRVLTLLYAGERDFAGSPRAVEPHQVVHANGRAYIVAWCRHARDWRHFRADRVLDASIDAAEFEPRAFLAVEQPKDLLRAGQADTDDVVVRYSPAVARWLAERHPEAKRLPDGALEVTHRVAEPAWLVRQVLGYADEAEVVAPAAYRAAVRRAVTA